MYFSRYQFNWQQDSIVLPSLFQHFIEIQLIWELINKVQLWLLWLQKSFSKLLIMCKKKRTRLLLTAFNHLMQFHLNLKHFHHHRCPFCSSSTFFMKLFSLSFSFSVSLSLYFNVVCSNSIFMVHLVRELKCNSLLYRKKKNREEKKKKNEILA